LEIEWSRGKRGNLVRIDIARSLIIYTGVEAVSGARPVKFVTKAKTKRAVCTLVAPHLR
jgi:hypothetical protein